MNLGCLFSGGKDSTYALYKSINDGHNISCLISLHAFNDESLLYHYPNNHLLDKISKAIEIPIIERYCYNSDKDYEIEQLNLSIKEAVDKYSIEGLVHGAISSKFQLDIFKNICSKLKLKLFSPLWNMEPYNYYYELLESKFEIIITRVAALGLEKEWLGKVIDKENYKILRKLCDKFKFNITFEGGEAETLVLDCPLYKKKIELVNYDVNWDGIRGTFEILDAILIIK